MHACPLTLDQLDVGQPDPAATLAHEGVQAHRSGIGGGQEVDRYCDGLGVRVAAIGLIGRPGGLGAQRDHDPAVQLGPDGPVFVEVRRVAACACRAQHHGIGEQRDHDRPF